MRRRKQLMNQINVVPYVDVMLVLLVIFMVTAPLLTPGLVELPSVAKSSQPPEAPLEVIIRTDQSMLLKATVPPKRLPMFLSARKGAAGGGESLMIRTVRCREDNRP